MIACASQTMAWVAQSKFDAYIGWDLNAWDVAAGIVIVEESGGLVSNFDGSRADITSRDMIITCFRRRNDDFDESKEELDEEDGNMLKDELIQIMRENNCLDY